MSYIKSCTKCGERISLREMSHGQWVAFDANSDKPHKHGKGSRKKGSAQKESNYTSSNQAHSTESSSDIPTFVILGLIILSIFYFLS